MKKLSESSYDKVIKAISPLSPGAVYPLSVAGKIQSGDVYVSESSFFIWHYCGFASLTGGCTAKEADEIYEMMKSGKRRLVLFSDDEKTVSLFSGKPDIVTERRFFYKFDPERFAEYPLPDGTGICALTSGNIGDITGRITPAFSWESSDEFLRKGKGFCVTDCGKILSWAFSAAVSGAQVDIGVETDENYRGKGLVSAAASAMIKHILSEGKEPVWACHSENAASRRTAEKLGFVKTAECVTIRRNCM